jgi:hypothetical protein
MNNNPITMVNEQDKAVNGQPEDDSKQDGVTKGNTPTEQHSDDDERIHTVTPDNDSGDPGPPAEERDAGESEE